MFNAIFIVLIVVVLLLAIWSIYIIKTKKGYIGPPNPKDLKSHLNILPVKFNPIDPAGSYGINKKLYYYVVGGVGSCINNIIKVHIKCMELTKNSSKILPISVCNKKISTKLYPKQTKFKCSSTRAK